MWLRRWKNQLLWALFGRNTLLPAPESAISYIQGNRRMVWDSGSWRMEKHKERGTRRVRRA